MASSFIIPSPQQIKWQSGSFRIERPLSAFVGAQLDGSSPGAFTRKYLQEQIGAVITSRHRERSKTALVIRLLNSLERKSTMPFAKERLAVEQGYILMIKRGGIEIQACSMQGVLYALVSLRQIIKFYAQGHSIPCVSIMDWPDFKYRFCSHWLIMAEFAGWSYDRGDGPGKYLERIKRKLDFCMEYKINGVVFDGFGWNPERFKGYAGLMRKFNAFAQERGIRLSFGGWSEGYNLNFPDQRIDAAITGRRFENRVPYPRGKPYFCRVEPFRFSAHKETATSGTCLGNEPLLDAKLRYLQDFVRAVRPTALYIHPIDAGTFKVAKASWRLRCPKCRRLWPSERLDTQNGMAGSFSRWYGKIIAAVNSVKTPGGYEAQKHCLIRLVHPLYTRFGEDRKSDKVWREELKYYRRIGLSLKAEKNVVFVVREQFYGFSGDRRFAELKKILGKHQLECFCVGGGDFYLNDLLLAPAASFNHVFKGADSIYNFCGRSNQEPLQVFNAEFSWNCDSPYKIRTPSDPMQCRGLFKRLCNGALLPDGAFRKHGLLENICGRLYGSRSGRYIAELQKLRSRSGHGPLWNPYPYFNYRGGFNYFGGFDQPYANKLNLPEFWKDKYEITVAGLKLTEEALAAVDKRMPEEEDLQWLVKSLRAGSLLCAAICSLCKGNQQKYAKNLVELRSYVRDNLSRRTICPLGGAVGPWEKVAETGMF